jgi:hypothetical protein
LFPLLASVQEWPPSWPPNATDFFFFGRIIVDSVSPPEKNQGVTGKFILMPLFANNVCRREPRGCFLCPHQLP